MALANVAVSLALKGKKVLVVDFDLEAPGLDTFNLLKPKKGNFPGLVDYTSKYLEDEIAPKVTDYIEECPEIGDAGGKIWIMPSGKYDGYIRNYNQIDWVDLYKNHHGYLLFEEIKEQWKQYLKPDYVLIDSRTGHTDTGGICTRQLPDAVVIQFFPNEQNLRGLKKIVKGIRDEKLTPRKKDIYLHFVVSNIPSLDDEDQILAGILNTFENELAFRSPTFIHRYDSIQLLKQEIFTKERPRSSLAKEYTTLANKIAIENPQDRDGALDYINRFGRRWRGIGLEEIDRLDRIEDIHRDDKEVLYHLGVLREKLGQQDNAEILIDRAIDLGFKDPEAFLKRARTRLKHNDEKGFTQDLKSILGSEDVFPPVLRQALDLLLKNNKLELEKISNYKAIISLDNQNKIWLASSFNFSVTDLELSKAILESIEYETLKGAEKSEFHHYLGLVYMGLGQCAEALELFIIDGKKEDGGIVSKFNYGMASWAVTSEFPAIFETVVELDKQEIHNDKDAYYYQCLALAYHGVNDKENARDNLNKAQDLIEATNRGSVFSCWRYYETNREEFKKDLNEISALIEGKSKNLPMFFPT